ncbi:uncharacterized protein EAF02_011800 [Botrytis sinoallii]|uniref:uncharacterized protein n=1 Tax=Botrytis sinoallii TaxID=1463999 RepID=UPI0019005A4A|nr:uncharacterized protein EAF02_011800 [Botrytis sinoallii]KAF7853810.1 hypothetical protein EAF02_011800 [Botrytis sinoallii]
MPYIATNLLSRFSSPLLSIICRTCLHRFSVDTNIEIDMVSLSPFVFLSSSFSCSRSGSKKRSRIKSRFSSKIAGQTSYTIYRAENSSLEQLLVPSDHSIAESIQSYQESRRSSLGQNWHLSSHSKGTKIEANNSNREFGSYYLLAVISGPAPSTAKSLPEKRKSITMASKFPPSDEGTNKIFGESFGSATKDVQGERRRSYGIGGAGIFVNHPRVIYTPRERLVPEFSNHLSRYEEGKFLVVVGIGMAKKR